MAYFMVEFIYMGVVELQGTRSKQGNHKMKKKYCPQRDSNPRQAQSSNWKTAVLPIRPRDQMNNSV